MISCVHKIGGKSPDKVTGSGSKSPAMKKRREKKSCQNPCIVAGGCEGNETTPPMAEGMSRHIFRWQQVCEQTVSCGLVHTGGVLAHRILCASSPHTRGDPPFAYFITLEAGLLSLCIAAV